MLVLNSAQVSFTACYHLPALLVSACCCGLLTDFSKSGMFFTLSINVQYISG